LLCLLTCGDGRCLCVYLLCVLPGSSPCLWQTLHSSPVLPNSQTYTTMAPPVLACCFCVLLLLLQGQLLLLLVL